MKEGWEYKKLGEVATVVGGSTPKTNVQEYWGGSNYWVTPADLNGNKYQGETPRTITDLAVQKTNLQLLPIGTVLLSSRAPIGKVAITTTPMYCNQGFKNIICSDKILSEFVYWYLYGKTDFLNSLGTGATFKEISKKVVEKIEIPIPPLTEQERIVSELDLLTSIINKQKAQLKELDSLAQSIFYDMFGDPIENPKGWEVKKLGDLCNSELGKTLNQSKDTGTLRPYLCAINIQWNKIIKDNLKQTRFEETELERYSVKKGDLLICEGGDIGRAAIWNENKEIQYQNALHRLRFGEEMLPIFCLFNLKYLKDKGILDNRYGKGVTIKHLIKSALLSIPFIVPPLSLQQSFATKIEAIEAQKALITKSMEETQRLFDSRMDYWFA